MHTFPVWVANVTNPNASTDVDTLCETAESVYEDLSNGVMLNLSFASDTPQLNGEHLAMVLRATFALRESPQINGWLEALATCYKIVVSEGKDVNDVLFGFVPEFINHNSEKG